MPLDDLRKATPETTTDDIKQYASEIIKEVAQERQSERKSDAEIIARSSPPTKQPAEQISSSDKVVPDLSNSSAKAESQGDSGDSPKNPEWLDSELLSEASALGISEAELSDFSSREEFERAVRLLDKAALESGRKAMSEGSDGPARNEKGQFVKKEGPDESKELAPPSDRYEVSLSTEKWEDDIVNEFSRMRDYYETRLQSLESQFMAEMLRAEEDRFDKFVDTLGHTELFGTTGKESDRELERRKDLLVAVRAHIIGLNALGRPAKFDGRLIGRVANMVFSEELGKKLIKQQTAKVSRQNQLRQGGSPIKPLPPSEDPREAFDRLYRELEKT